MGQKIEREWKSIVCPDWKEKTAVIREWNILSEKGNGLQRTLTLIDCHNPRLSEFGGSDCNWTCEKAIAKPGTIKSEVEQLLVSIILAAGILWIGFYNIYISPHLHLYGLFLFFGIPFVIGLMLYYGWKMMRYIRGSSKKIFSKHKRISEIASFTSAWHRTCDV
jgi:hypothetical protein